MTAETFLAFLLGVIFGSVAVAIAAVWVGLKYNATVRVTKPKHPPEGETAVRLRGALDKIREQATQPLKRLQTNRLNLLMAIEEKSKRRPRIAAVIAKIIREAHPWERAIDAEARATRVQDCLSQIAAYPWKDPLWKIELGNLHRDYLTRFNDEVKARRSPSPRPKDDCPTGDGMVVTPPRHDTSN